MESSSQLITGQTEGGTKTHDNIAAPEAKENPDGTNYLATVLEASLPKIDGASGTSEQETIAPHALTTNFLGSKFRFVACKEEPYFRLNQPCYHFAVMGNKSGFYVPGDENQHEFTTVADMINILCETTPSKTAFVLLESYIKSWLVWLYQRSFGVELDSRKIKLKWEENKLQDVTYDPPENFENSVSIDEAEEHKNSVVVPLGDVSKKRRTQKILDNENRLLLPGGISPDHDIVVPEELLKLNPSCTLPLGKNGEYGQWAGITAEMIAANIRHIQKFKHEPTKEVQNSILNRAIRYNSIAGYVNGEDKYMEALAEFLLKKFPPEKHTERIMTLVRFVQSFAYKNRYGFKGEHSGLLTIFNGGGHCSSATILWNQLMRMAGYSSAVLYIAFKEEKHELHARGGIPLEYFPDVKRHWGKNEDANHYIPIELTGPFELGHESWGKNETTIAIDEIPCPKTPGNVGNIEGRPALVPANVQNAVRAYLVPLTLAVGFALGGATFGYVLPMLRRSPASLITGQNNEQTPTSAPSVSVPPATPSKKNLIESINNSDKRKQLDTYITLLESAKTGELYKLPLDQLKTKWPNGEWNGEFYPQNKDQNIKRITQKLQAAFIASLSQ